MSALTVVALHHHLAAPPWRAARRCPLSGRDGVLRALVAAGVELVVGGHVHQGAISERREFRVLEADPDARSCSQPHRHLDVRGRSAARRLEA